MATYQFGNRRGHKKYAVVFHGNRISRLHWARNSRVIVICGAIDPSEIREMDFRQVCVEEHSNYRSGGSTQGQPAPRSTDHISYAPSTALSVSSS